MPRILERFFRTVSLALFIFSVMYFVLPISVQLNILSQKANVVTEVFASSGPVVEVVNPSTGTNNGSITVKATVSYVTADSIRLKKIGQSDIIGTGLVVAPASPAPGKLGAIPPMFNYNISFDLTDKATGYWDIIPSTAGVDGGTTSNGFLIIQALNSTSNIDNTITTTLTLTPDSGHITLGIPPNTFNQNVSLTASMTSVPSSDRETIKITNIGIEVTTDKNAQPDKAITITMYYRDSDIAGLDESKLVICRYDSTNNLWTPLPSTVYPDQNKVVAQTDHLSKFVLVQLAPAANLGSIKVYPNPLNSKLYSMTIANLTATADIKIYNVAGELVRKLDYSTGNGQVIWDGKNDGGSLVASGVYIIYINSPQGTKKIKVAIEK